MCEIDGLLVSQNRVDGRDCVAGIMRGIIYRVAGECSCGSGFLGFWIVVDVSEWMSDDEW